MKSTLTVMSVAASLSFAASGHAGQQHVMGVIKSVDDNAIVVQVKGGKDVSATIDATTKFETTQGAATLKDVKPGERVVVHARKEGSSLKATLIKTAPSVGNEKMPGQHEHGAHGRSP